MGFTAGGSGMESQLEEPSEGFQSLLVVRSV